MEILRDPGAMRAAVQRLRGGGHTLAFVPTMGNLHAGHLALVAAARRHAEVVVASIFVNPLQFNDPADYAAYPRTFEEDVAALGEAGVAAVFAPAPGSIYARAPGRNTRVIVPGLSDTLCGLFRPGHFAGVATVVCKLFNIVRPDVAVFGEKDYQQLLLIQRLVEDLDLAVDIVPVPTVRERDGLAMSSRNRYLDEAERRRAPVLYRSLCEAAAALEAGRKDYAALEAAGMAAVAAGGLRPEYFSIRRAGDLALPHPGDRELIVLAAAWLGSARLIDNVRAAWRKE